MKRKLLKKVLFGALHVGILLALVVVLAGFSFQKGKAEPLLSACREIWDFSVTVKDANNNSQILTFGQGLTATAGVDAACDIIAPPAPPAGAFNANFTVAPNSFYTDYLLAKLPGTFTWPVVYQLSLSPVTFSWDPTKLPSSGTWFLQDPITGTLFAPPVNMRTQSSFIVPYAFLTQVNIVNTSPRCTVTAVSNGDWNSAATWDTNCSGVPTLTDDVYIPAPYAVNFTTGATSVGSLTVDANASLSLSTANPMTVTGNVNIYGGTLNLGSQGKFIVDGIFNNTGTVNQTANVNSSCTEASPCRFPSILNTAGTVYPYPAIDIVPTGGDLNLGSTAFSISGGQVCGATGGTLDQTVQRCYRITPTSPLAATLTFYYLSGEANGNSAPSMWNYHAGAWIPATSNTRGTVGEVSYVRGTGISQYSPFALKDNAPTATRLTGLRATSNAVDPVRSGLPAAGALFLGLAAVALLKFRKGTR